MRVSLEGAGGVLISSQGSTTATTVLGTVVAVFVVGLMCGCVADAGDLAPTTSPATPASGRSGDGSSPAVMQPPAIVPDIPRRSAALAEQPPPPPAPVRLEVAALGIDVKIAPVGLDAEGRMALIEDPSIAAWYAWGPTPASESGSMVIAAHVDSLTYDLLPFARLRDATPGTEVLVTDATGARHVYVVQTSEVVVKEEVDWDAAFDRSGPPRLTLVTCGGEFDYSARRYLSNLVVTATPTA